jgi:hypothetical protein
MNIVKTIDALVDDIYTLYKQVLILRHALWLACNEDIKIMEKYIEIAKTSNL